jgi:hypothetical protein
MIDRDSYSPGSRGYDEFVADARAFLEMVRSYVAFDVTLDGAVSVADVQRLVDAARRTLAASAVDELAALAELMADVAGELGAPIEEDLRAAKRLIDMIYAEICGNRLPELKRVETTLFDPAEIPEFTSWRYDRYRQ